MLHFVSVILALQTAAPQNPTTPAAPTQEHAVVTTGPADPATDNALAAASLHRAEKAGPSEETTQVVVQLVQHADAAIAARAAWLLGEWKSVRGVDALAQALAQNGNPDLRLQCAAALDRIQNSAATEALTRGLQDADIAVRAFAVQSLARRKAEGTSQQLLALIERQGSTEPKSSHKDVTAALIALADLGDTSAMLPAAAAVHFASDESGPALAFLFQELSPKLPPEIEATTLVAALDHCEPLLRRYAIQRLGELRDPTTARALEGRLATEDPALQPLIRVSLAQVRRDKVENGADLALRAKSNAIAIGRLVERQWDSMETGTRLSTAATVCVVSFGLLMILVARRRAQRREAAIAAAAASSASHAAMLRTNRTETRAMPRFEHTPRTPVGSGRF
jgi:HEAT repeat protein